MTLSEKDIIFVREFTKNNVVMYPIRVIQCKRIADELELALEEYHSEAKKTHAFRFTPEDKVRYYRYDDLKEFLEKRIIKTLRGGK